MSARVAETAVRTSGDSPNEEAFATRMKVDNDHHASLLSLPAEVRMQIYHELFQGMTIWFQSTYKEAGDDLVLQPCTYSYPEVGMPNGILRSCKLVREEATSVVHKVAVVGIRWCAPLDEKDQDSLHILGVPEIWQQSIQRLRFNVGAPLNFDTQALTSLKEVVIDYDVHLPNRWQGDSSYEVLEDIALGTHSEWAQKHFSNLAAAWKVKHDVRITLWRYLNRTIRGWTSFYRVWIDHKSWKCVRVEQWRRLARGIGENVWDEIKPSQPNKRKRVLED